MEKHTRHINCYYNTLTAYPMGHDAFTSTEQSTFERVLRMLFDEDVCPPLKLHVIR